MNRLRLPAVAKYLVGILLVQGITALLVAMALKTNLAESWILAVALALLVGSLATFWFTSIANRSRRSALAKADEKYGKRQASTRRRSEKAKDREVEETRRRTMREAKQIQRSTNRKLWTALAGVSAGSVVLLFTQFMWLGLVATAAVGGTAVGYGLRARHLLPSRKQKPTNETFQPQEDVKRIPSPEKETRRS